MHDGGEKRSRFKAALNFLKRLIGKKPAQPGDPYAYVTAPVPGVPRDAAARPRWKRTGSIAIRRARTRSARVPSAVRHAPPPAAQRGSRMHQLKHRCT